MTAGLGSISPSPEHLALAEAVRGFLESRAPLTWVRERMEQSGFDPEVHARLAQDLGLHGLAIPEQYGGSGFGLAEQFVVLEQLGRGLYPGPYLATAVIATTALLLADDDAACATYLPGLADGSRTATLVDTVLTGGREDPLSVEVARTETGLTVSGDAAFVVDGATADLFLVLARLDGKPSLLAVPRDGGHVSAASSSVLDKTRPLAVVSFDAAPANPVGPPGDAVRYRDRLRAIASSALAAESTGAAARCLEMTVEYVKIREQFARPIGSFQSIKHRCADMLIRLEAARSATAYASWAIVTESDELLIAAAVAASTCAETFVFIAQQMIQLHGGIGFTWEHDAHLYLRRAKSSATLFGSPERHLGQLATFVGI
jgi:alkylation response protein AidB-like acyl-CoA dehydrogenase